MSDEQEQWQKEAEERWKELEKFSKKIIGWKPLSKKDLLVDGYLTAMRKVQQEDSETWKMLFETLQKENVQLRRNISLIKDCCDGNVQTKKSISKLIEGWKL